MYVAFAARAPSHARSHPSRCLATYVWTRISFLSGWHVAPTYGPQAYMRGGFLDRKKWSRTHVTLFGMARG